MKESLKTASGTAMEHLIIIIMKYKLGILITTTTWVPKKNKILPLIY